MKTLAQTNKGNASLGTLVAGMYRDQGIAGFYRGVQVNIARACVLNATKMGVYDMTKGYVTEATGWSRKDVRTAFCSSFVAGFFMTCTGELVRCGMLLISPMYPSSEFRPAFPMLTHHRSFAIVSA